MASAMDTLAGTPWMHWGTPRLAGVVLLCDVLHLVGVLVGCRACQEYSDSASTTHGIHSQTQAINLCRAQPSTRRMVC